MDRFKNFLNTKGFYVALCVGIFAIAILMVAGDFRDAKDKLSKEQSIDLNEPADDTTVAGGDKGKQVANNDEVNSDVQETNSNNAVADVKPDMASVEQNNNQQINVVENEPVISAEPLVFDEERALVWPIIGDVIIPFNMESTVYFKTLDTYKCNPGMVIEAEEGAKVASACKGCIKSIEDTKEFGTVVKVDLGSGYEAVYGQLMNITVGEGDMISESEIIGEIAPVSSYYKEEGNNLYFAITKDDVPVDPMTLIQ